MTLDGVAQASTGMTAVTVSEGGVERIAGFVATSYSNPDGSGGAQLELLGDVLVPGTITADKIVVGGFLQKYFEAHYDDAVTQTVGETKDDPGTIGPAVTVCEVTTVDQSGSTDIRFGFTAQADPTMQVDVDFTWQLEAVSTIYFGPIRILDSGTVTVPPTSGTGQDFSGVFFEHRDMPAGSKVRLVVSGMALGESFEIDATVMASQRLKVVPPP